MGNSDCFPTRRCRMLSGVTLAGGGCGANRVVLVWCVGVFWGAGY